MALRNSIVRSLIIAGLALAIVPGTASVSRAQPRAGSEQSWTAYDTGSSGFNIAVAIAQQFKQKSGIDVRILPSGNDTGRLAPARAGRAQVSQMGIGVYFAQEGVLEFGTRAWGPQPLRLLMTATSCNGITLAVARDTGVREVRDLRGKRVGVVVGSPALTQGMLGLIAFGGLTRNDVRVVEFSSNNAMWKGILNNEADAAVASTVSGQSKEADSSPRGIIFPPFPAADREGWARIHRIAPYFTPVRATCGAGGLDKTPTDVAGYAYPIFVTYADRPTDQTQAIVQTMIDTYPGYKDGAPGADGMALDKQTLTWVLPYHEGAVRAFKAARVWTDAAQKHNDGLVRRQEVLAAAWKAFLAKAPADDKEFATAWTKARADALKAAGLDPIFE